MPGFPLRTSFFPSRSSPAPGSVVDVDELVEVVVVGTVVLVVVAGGTMLVTVAA
jgi:hypothetical protein